MEEFIVLTDPDLPLEQPKQHRIEEKKQHRKKKREEREALNSRQAVDSAFSSPDTNSVNEAFSLPEKLLPAQKDLITRILTRENTWNEAGLSPPCRLIMFSPLQIQDVTPTMDSYSDEDIDKAIRNYARKFHSGNLDEKPCGNFVNFIIRWVENYVDEAEPFFQAAAKWAALPKRGAQRELATHGESFS